MVRSLLSALFGGSRRSARVTPTPAPRFVPTVQALEVREVPAVLGLFAPVDSAPAAPVDDAQTAVVARPTTAAQPQPNADGFLAIKFEDTLVSGYSVQGSGKIAADTGADTTADTAADAKVKFQDISFTSKVSKASPMLML